MSIVIAILVLLLSILSLIVCASQYKFNYWRKKKIPFVKPVPILGNYGPYILQQKNIGPLVESICLQFPKAPCIGAFYGTEPTLVVQDPEHLKLVLTKDFYYFHGREVTESCHKEVTTQNIFFYGGDRWKVIRQNMTPLFSSAKMKSMFYLIEKATRNFEALLDDCVKESQVLEVRLLCVKYTMESVGSCVFGVETRTIDNNSDRNPFFSIGNDIFDNSSYRGFKLMSRSIWPSIFYGVGFKVFPDSITSFFSELLMDVFKSRGHKPSGRKDFIDLVLSLKENDYITGDSMSNLKDGGTKKVHVKVDDDLLVAQCSTLFAGGFETSATTMSFTLYELAKNQKAQKLAQAEVDNFLVRHGNCITYDCVNELPYCDACLDETMRLYPVLPVLTREVMANYEFPSGLQLDKGVRIHIPVYKLHRDPEHFPEPEEYRPERFLPDQKKDIKPYTYLPFGEGPKNCIGRRFGKMQMLAGMMVFLKKYTVELAEDMPPKVDLHAVAMVTQPIGGIRLKFKLREGRENHLLDSLVV